ncbi:DUF4221 family protein [Algoriphagus namhaensis]
MKKWLVILYPTFLLILGCSRVSQNYSDLKLVSKRILEIPLEETTSASWGTLQYLDLETDEYLVYHDLIKSPNKEIHFFHLNENDKSFKVDVSMDGPNGVGHLDAVHVKNLDSIYVLNRFAYRLFHIDKSGIVKNTYSLTSDKKQVSQGLTYLPGSLPFSPIVDLGMQLFLPARADVNPLENFNYKSFNTGIFLNLEDKTVRYNLFYPESYFNSGFWGMQLEIPSTVVNFKDSVIIQSFPIEDRLMIYDFDLNLIDTPSLFSEFYKGEFHSLSEATLDPKIFYPHIYSNPSNKSILFDPYRDLYYRIYNGPYPDATIENMARSNFTFWDKKNQYPTRILMVFDRGFKEVGLIELDRDRYFVDFIRVVKDGLLIQVQSDDEDKNVFEIFEIKY